MAWGPKTSVSPPTSVAVMVNSPPREVTSALWLVLRAVLTQSPLPLHSRPVVSSSVVQSTAT